MTHAVPAGERRLIARRRLFGNPTHTMCRISPDGETLSWLAPKDGVLNLWIAPRLAPSEARCITDDRGRGIRMYAWARDGRHLLYMQDREGDENWHVYAVDHDAGSERDLTPIDGVAGRVYGVSWSRPGTIAIGLNDRDASWHDIYCVDLASGERELSFLNEAEYSGVTLDDALVVRMAEKSLQEGGRKVFKCVDGAFEEMLHIDHEDYLVTQVLGFETDGKHFHMLSSLGRDTAALMRRNWADNSEVLMGAHDRANVSRLIRHPTRQVVEAYGVNDLKLKWTPVCDAVAGDLEFLQGELDGEIAITGRNKDDTFWVISASGAQEPGTYHLYDRRERGLARLFSSRPELEDETLRPMYPVVIPSRDGLELVSYLTLPGDVTAPPSETHDRPDAPVPMVLVVHGGPWSRDEYGFNSYHQWLTDRGYAVLSVNFRGSTGFGKSFVNAGDLEWGRKMHDDLLDAVDWAIEQGITTREKIAIMGGSYGGYATLAGLAFTPEVFCCGVDIVGPSNLETLLATVPPYWKAFFENLARRVGDPRTPEGLALLKARSPLHKADAIAKPLLIGQGANDPRVKQAESDQIVDEMKAKGLAVTYALYPDEGHGFARPENRLSFFAVVEAFFAAQLGGVAEPIGDDFANSSLTVPEGAGHVPGVVDALTKMTVEAN